MASLVAALGAIVPYFMSVGMVIGPVTPYVPQYLETRRTGVGGGFAPLVSFLLLVSSFGRVVFWYLMRFDATLLWQALVMIVAQLALLRQQCQLFAAAGEQASVWDMNLRTFWRWVAFSDYLVVLGLLLLGLSIIVVSFQGSTTLGTALGYVSLLAESAISVPQLVTNYQRGTTVGLSATMIAMWFAGDCFKIGYFALFPAPVVFMVCTVVQTSIDFLISLQIVRTKLQQRRAASGQVSAVRHGRRYEMVPTLQPAEPQDGHAVVITPTRHDTDRTATGAELGSADSDDGDDQRRLIGKAAARSRHD